MIGSWYLLIPVLLPILSGLAVCFLKPFEDMKKRNLFTLCVMVVNVLALLPVLFSPSMSLTLFTLSDSLPIFLRTDGLGKVFAGMDNPALADVCKEFLVSKDVATVGTGLDIYARNKFPSVTQEVQAIADSETASPNRTKARKILDRE